MAKVIITRGRPFELMVDVKQPESPTPAQLPETATAVFHLMEKGTQTGGSLIVKDMVRVPDVEPITGYVDTIFKVQLDAIETADLPYEYGYTEDGENYKDTCRAQVAMDSPDSPNVQFADALIPNIYVSDIGL